MFVEMKVRGLALDAVSNMPIIILRDEEDKRSLQIWVGIFEANAIALELEKVATARPMTHDLLRSFLEQLGGKVEKIVISDLRESTFFAVIHVRNQNAALTIDARPSDAIALALRTESPIFVLRTVLDKAQAVDLATDASDEEKLKKWLEEISPDELGKWTM